MITIAIPSQGIRFFLVCLGIILITSCSTARSTHHIAITLYSKCLTPTNVTKEAKQANEEGEKPLYLYLLSRVRRWVGQHITPDIIRTFSDHGKARYADLTDAALWLQQTFHDMRGVVGLLNGRDHHYFIKTSQGKYAEASLVLLPKDKRTPKKVYLMGRLEIGIDKESPNIIYHMMFRPRKDQPPLKVPYCPEIDPHRGHQAYSSTVKHCNKNDTSKGYCISKQGNNYVIEYDTLPKNSPYKSKKLYIHYKAKKCPW